MKPLKLFHLSSLSLKRINCFFNHRNGDILFFVILKIICGIIVLFCYISRITNAIELSEDIQVHGFFSQGYFLTSENDLFGESSSGGSFDFTEIGINASWTPISNLRLAAQALFRRAGVGHEHDLSLDFGLLDYSIISTVDTHFGVRLGRFKNPYGLYNDTRDVIFTRPTILLPQSIYLERTRNLSLSADGGMVYGEHRTEQGNLSVEIGVGYPRADDLDTELGILSDDYPGHFESRLSYIGRLGYDLEEGKYRAVISTAHVHVKYDPKSPYPNDDLFPGKDIFKPVIFSLQYNSESLSLTSEYAIRTIQESGLFSRDNEFEIIGESYYLQAQYRFNQAWQAIVRYDVLYNNRNDKKGKKYQALTGNPDFSQFAKDWTMGLRYNLNPSFLIAAEYHNINGTAWLPIQDNPNFNDLERRWHLFALMAAFRF